MTQLTAYDRGIAWLNSALFFKSTKNPEFSNAWEYPVVFRRTIGPIMLDLMVLNESTEAARRRPTGEEMTVFEAFTKIVLS